MKIVNYDGGLIVAYLDEGDLAPEPWGGEWRNCLAEPRLAGATHLRLELPLDDGRLQALTEAGFVFADRLLDLSINLPRSGVDYAKMIRTAPEWTEGCREEIRDIARRSFPRDRRFHLGRELDQRSAEKILDRWVEELEGAWVCRVKGAVAGFLAPREEGDAVHVHLAAVDKRYRLAGLGLSLYAHAAQVCRERGFRALRGRVSSGNLAVMNLYVALGAAFTGVRDVLLREVWDERS